MECANVTKIQTPHLPDTLSPLTSMRCTKTPPGMASYRKSLLTSHSVMEMCFSCFMNTKYIFLRYKLPICNKCSVFEENEDVEGLKVGKKKERLDEHCISPASPRSKHGDTCLFPCFNDRRRFDVFYHAGIKSTLCRTYF